ncbi:MAG: hypothetical protein GY835_18925, partial [bacterium]|nr:hypothetical protein [bacterium]
ISYGSDLNDIPIQDEALWGRFTFGRRDDDGAKIGRVTGGGSGLVASMGWSWGLDTAQRLTSAFVGVGSLEEDDPTGSFEEFGFGYGNGDQLDWMTQGSSGRTGFTSGESGRVKTREGYDGEFAYDRTGRRVDDDRFTYRWDWRGRLREVTVKDEWPAGDPLDPGAAPIVPIYAGHQICYKYDTFGRLLERIHWAPLDDDDERPFIERRVFVWEGNTLLTETAYGDPERDINMRWRKTYIPGPTGLDDAVQVRVEIFFGDPAMADTVYSYVRDEMGTVIAIIEETEGLPGVELPLLARYNYAPYGEFHIELGPELRQAQFDTALTSIETESGTVDQVITDQQTAAPGAFLVTMSFPLEQASFAAGIELWERPTASGDWQIVLDGEYVLAPAAGHPEQLVIMALSGWQRASTYRLTLDEQLVDVAGRSFVGNSQFEWSVPESTVD